jgi:hypothetical protein
MPTKNPGFGAGNRLVTRFGRVDDMDNDQAVRIPGNNLNKKRFPSVAAGPVFALNANNFTQATEGPDPASGSMLAGYELQNQGNAYRIEHLDSDVGMPDVTTYFQTTDWIDNKSVATDQIIQLYARASQTGGSGSLGFGSSPLDVWRIISGPLGMLENMLLLLVSPAGAGFEEWQGTVELSRDQVIIEDTATINLSTNQTGP